MSISALILTTSPHALRSTSALSCWIPVRFGGKGVGFRRGRGPGSSCWVRVDGPERKESTSCSGVCVCFCVGIVGAGAGAGLGIDFGIGFVGL